MRTMPCRRPLLVILAAFGLCSGAWSGEASATAMDVPKAQRAIAAAIVAVDGNLPAWVADPTLDDVLPEATCGIGEEAGSAVMAGLLDLARMRESRIVMADKSGTAAAPAEIMDRSTTSVSFGPIKVQAVIKHYVREEGEITSTTTSAATVTITEATERIAGPLFTCKHWSRESGEAGKIATASASWVWEWDAATPVTGAQVLASLADQGVMVADLIPIDGHGIGAWLVALPSGIAKPAGPGHLLPYQALAVAMVGVLQRAEAGVLPGADVTRPSAGVIEIAWPQADANLTIRVNGAGQVIGVTARQKVDNQTRPLLALAKESIMAAVGEMTVERTLTGERWR